MSLQRLRDLSNWQGPVDWTLERKEVAAVYVKVTEGSSFVDQTGAHRIHEATRARVRCGGYHFAHPGVGTPAAQGRQLLKHAPLGPGRLRPCVDCEWNELGLNGAQLAAWYLGLVGFLTFETGYTPVLYGSPSYLGSFVLHHPDLFGRCPLWLAEYGVRLPTVPAPWSHWDAWQWTDTFKDPAVGRVDDSYVADLTELTVPHTAKAIEAAVRYGGWRRFANA